MNIRSIIALSLFAIGLGLGRLLLAENTSYLWLNWNLFLALLPLLAVWCILRTPWRWLQIILLLIWLGFLPNAPYLLTDFIHLENVGPSHLLWYDGLMMFVYSLAGVGSWLLSTFLLARRFFWTHSIVFLISVLTGFGIYLGRYIRFNTWDMITHPTEILRTLFDVVIHPAQHEPVILMTGVYAIFLFFCYRIFTPFFTKK